MGLDALIRTTFAHPDAAQSALDAAGGDLPRARLALARKKSTAPNPALGPRILGLLACARACGSPPKRNSGSIDYMGVDIPADLAALQFASAHWLLYKVELGGACLHGAGTTTSDKRLAGGSAMPLKLGHLASGEVVVCRYAAGGGSTWVAVPAEGPERTFAGLDALLAHIVDDAAARGVTGLLAPPGRTPTATGPPAVTPGDVHRVYAGAQLVDAEVAFADLFFEKRVVVSLRRKRALPADDLWLVSRDGVLYKLTPLMPMRGGSMACSVAQV